MGRRGPVPTPTAILKQRGSWRAKAREGKEVKGPVGTPICPSWLNQEAKNTWKRIVPKLRAMNVLTMIDGEALARYCQVSSRWKRAELFIQKHGDTYPLKDEKGQIRCLQQFPQVAIANKLAIQLARLEQEFGLTPSARSRITQVSGQPLRLESLTGDERKRSLLKDRFFATPPWPGR
jgi:P27 family predicted phage terminase small subunit